METTPTKKSDFNPQDLIQTQTNLGTRIEYLEAKISTNEKFVDFFTKSISDSKKIERELKKIFKDIVEKDDDTRESIKKLIQESDKHDIRITLKKMSGAVGWLVSLVITAVVSVIITSLFKK